MALRHRARFAPAPSARRAQTCDRRAKNLVHVHAFARRGTDGRQPCAAQAVRDEQPESPNRLAELSGRVASKLSHTLKRWNNTDWSNCADKHGCVPRGKGQRVPDPGCVNSPQGHYVETAYALQCAAERFMWRVLRSRAFSSPRCSACSTDSGRNRHQHHDLSNFERPAHLRREVDRAFALREVITAVF